MVTDTEPDLKELCRPPKGHCRRFYTRNHKLKCYRTRPGRVNKWSIREHAVGERGRGGADYWAPAKERWAPVCQIRRLIRNIWQFVTLPNGFKHCPGERKLDYRLSSLQDFRFATPASSSQWGSHLSAVTQRFKPSFLESCCVILGMSVMLLVFPTVKWVKW